MGARFVDEYNLVVDTHGHQFRVPWCTHPHPSRKDEKVCDAVALCAVVVCELSDDELVSQDSVQRVIDDVTTWVEVAGVKVYYPAS